MNEEQVIMNTARERERQVDAAVEEALRRLPVTAAPDTLAPVVMARVRRQAAPRFQLRWIDYALSVFAGCMGGLTWLLAIRIPEPLRVHTEHQVVWLLHLLTAPPLWFALLGGTAVTCVLLLLATRVMRSP